MILPALSTDQMREVDRLMVEHFGIQLLQMMENAGRNLALLAKQLLSDEDDDEDALQDRPIVVLAGRGNNGGGGLAAARHLLNWGAWVQIVLTHLPTDLPPGAMKDQLSILQKMGAPLAWAEEGWELPPADLVVDALIGYGISGDPRGRSADLIQLANSSVAPILSLDAPSGLDSNSGQLYVPHVSATATMTLTLPKRGLLQPAARAACGQLFLADIGVPPSLYDYLDMDLPPLFAMNTVLPLHFQDGSFSLEE
ncbi:MAG: NAD(P)H-hydrate epimerase [Caldilineaceae bacterium]|nr:NAD(P)H-hydrate epimerase [Caldilineaceae bacterium]